MSEHDHCKDVVEELVRRLSELVKAYGCWDDPAPYETQYIQLLVMAEKLKKFMNRIPSIPDEK